MILLAENLFRDKTSYGMAYHKEKNWKGYFGITPMQEYAMLLKR